MDNLHALCRPLETQKLISRRVKWRPALKRGLDSEGEGTKGEQAAHFLSVTNHLIIFPTGLYLLLLGELPGERNL